MWGTGIVTNIGIDGCPLSRAQRKITVIPVSKKIMISAGVWKVPGAMLYGMGCSIGHKYGGEVSLLQMTGGFAPSCSAIPAGRARSRRCGSPLNVSLLSVSAAAYAGSVTVLVEEPGPEKAAYCRGDNAYMCCRCVRRETFVVSDS